MLYCVYVYVYQKIELQKTARRTKKKNSRLFSPYDTHHKGNGIYLLQREFKRFVNGIFRNEDNVPIIIPSSYSFNDYALFAIDNIDTVPLKKCIQR